MEPIYIRTDGNDVTGDGSLAAPFATAQKGFATAYFGEGEFVLDLGNGNFGGVDLPIAGATEWPVRISVRGVSAGASNLGGIYQDAHAGSITIIGDKTANLGNITGAGYNNNWAHSISLTDCIAGNVASGEANGSSNAILITNCEVGNISTGAGGACGNVSAIKSTAGNINATGIYAGDVFIQYSQVNIINAIGNIYYVDGEPFGRNGIISGTGYWGAYTDSVTFFSPRTFINSELAQGWVDGNFEGEFYAFLEGYYINGIKYVYFNASIDGNLLTIGNWWREPSFTTPVEYLPSSLDNVLIVANATSGTATYLSAGINSASIGSSVSITASSITLNGTSSNAGTLVGATALNNTAFNTGTITGETTLNTDSYNNGTITGNATFNANTYNGINGSVSGNATFRGTEGNAGTVGGAAEFFDTTENSGTVEGNATFRNSSSNAGGVVEGNATIYNPSANPVAGVVMGTETYLWPNGTGLWGGDVWIDGDIAFIIPQPSDVRSGVEYGPASAPYTGTYSGGAAKAISISQLLNLPFPINI